MATAAQITSNLANRRPRRIMSDRHRAQAKVSNQLASFRKPAAPRRRQRPRPKQIGFVSQNRQVGQAQVPSGLSRPNRLRFANLAAPVAGSGPGQSKLASFRKTARWARPRSPQGWRETNWLRFANPAAPVAGSGPGQSKLASFRKTAQASKARAPQSCPETPLASFRKTSRTPLAYHRNHLMVLQLCR
jgi:hypothetical protein